VAVVLGAVLVGVCEFVGWQIFVVFVVIGLVRLIVRPIVEAVGAHIRLGLADHANGEKNTLLGGTLLDLVSGVTFVLDPRGIGLDRSYEVL